MSWLLPPRAQQREWLDAADISPQDIQGNFEDLRRLNRYLGSTWVLLRACQRLWQKAGKPAHLRVLDIGLGAGDILEALTRWGQHRGVTLTLVGLDNHRGVLQYAQATQALPKAVQLVLADGLCLPFAERTFDIAVCSTMLHHLEWQEGITLLQTMAAVTRLGIILNDLVRGTLHYYVARLLLSLMARHAFTRHDGPLSVLRAYSVPEVRAMARCAGLEQAQVHLALGYRLLLEYTHPASV